MKQDIIKRLIVPEYTSIKKTLNVIERGSLGIALIAFSNNKFAGLVTDGDIRRGLIYGLGLEEPISKVIPKHQITAKEDTSKEILLKMFNKKIKYIPLLDKFGQIKDIVSFSELYKIPVAEPNLGFRELNYVTECITTNWVSSIGKYINKFEKEFSRFCECNYGITTSNGTAALHLALTAIDLRKGDEVIIPALTFVAVANVVHYTGATPILVDVDPKTWTIDPLKIREKITSKTKAIIPVHLYGHPCNMKPLLNIAKKNNLFVIEDCAEAHGAEYYNEKVGSFGDIGCFSFYGNKIITTGEGGMCVTNNSKLAEKMRILKNHGMSNKKKYWHDIVGFNYRMTNIQAALGCAQLERINNILETKRKNALLYNEILKGAKGITLPPEEVWAKNVYWMYSILVNENSTRDKLIQQLNNKNIETRPFFFPLSKLPPYKSKEHFPISEMLSERGINLPSSINLSEADIHFIANTLLEYL